MRNVRDRRLVQTEASLPNPIDQYFGYTEKRTWYPADVASGTREIVELVAGLCAPFAVALSSDYVTGKRHAIESFVAGW